MLRQALLFNLPVPFLMLAESPSWSDFVIASVVLTGLIAVWRAARKSEGAALKERTALISQLEKHTKELIRIQEERVREALEREDQRQALEKQTIEKFREVSQHIVQLQSAVLLAAVSIKNSSISGDKTHA